MSDEVVINFWRSTTCCRSSKPIGCGKELGVIASFLLVLWGDESERMRGGWGGGVVGGWGGGGGGCCGCWGGGGGVRGGVVGRVARVARQVRSGGVYHASSAV